MSALDHRQLPEHADILWSVGPLRCVLVPTDRPHKYEIQIWSRQAQVCAERCQDEGDAMEVADRLHEMFAK